jgi:queuine tRNA-ribosyltransferase
MRRGIYKFSEEKLDPTCACPTCARFSRAYLHHLTKTGETLGWQLLGQHNLYFYHSLMREIRASILADRFLDLYREKRAFLHEVDLDNPIKPPKIRPKKSLILGAYEVHAAGSDFASIRHIASGEIMHSRTPPIEEAHRLYVAQSNLAERVRWTGAGTPTDAEPLVIWDVGLGGAANAMAAIRCYEEEAARGPVRPLRIISFENDLDALRLAFRHEEKFRYLRHSGPAWVLRAGRWQSREHAGLSWELISGDFRETIATASGRPDLIFYDMFSSRADDAHWTPEAFRRLFRACAGRGAELFTYTFSTAARAALLAAGFYVAKGCATGDRAETTIAFTPETHRSSLPLRHELLSTDFLGKWTRSSAKYPAGMHLDHFPAFERAILDHAQFQSV